MRNVDLSSGERMLLGPASNEGSRFLFSLELEQNKSNLSFVSIKILKLIRYSEKIVLRLS